MSALREKLREKFRNPQEVMSALGLDAALLRKDPTMPAKPTKFASTALQLVAHALQPILAKDAKVDLMPIFSGLTRQNFDKAKVKMALDGALKGKLAGDAEPNMGHVASMLDHIEHMSKPEVADESVSQAQHGAMGAAAGGHSNLGIPQEVGKEFMRADKGKGFDAEAEGRAKNLGQFLKEKGVGDEDIEKACDMAFPPKPGTEEMREAGDRDVGLGGKAGDEETDEEKRRREEEEKRGEDNKMKGIGKDEMDAAIKSAVAAERANGRAIQQAFAAVKPWVGDLAMDEGVESATDVYRRAATALKIKDAATLHPDALFPIIESRPKLGMDRREERPSMAQDSAGIDDFNKRFGGQHIEIGSPSYRQ